MTTSVTIRRSPTLPALLDDASTRFIEVIQQLQSEGRIPRVVLTGGTAGIGLLRELREAEGIDWSTIHVFFGDERNVPLSHADSNERQAREALLDHVAIPAENIHSMALNGGDMTQAAKDYEQVLRRFAPEGYDIHLLGLGGEGHINSLFPHSAAVSETERTVVPVVDSPKPPLQRLTLTLPAVRQADRVWFLVAGAEKAEAAFQVATADVTAADDWPATGARGRLETVLFLANSAASRIDQKAQG